MVLLCFDLLLVHPFTRYTNYRSSQRIVHIPFFHQPKPLSPSQQARTEMILKEARSSASAAVGEIIKLGGKLISSEVQLHLQNHHLPFVIQHMPSLHFRVQKCYALALTAAELVRTSLNIKLNATDPFYKN